MRPLLFFLLLFSVIKLPAQFWGNTQQPIPADWTGGIHFGSAIQLDGNLAAIAAERHYTDVNGANVLQWAGAVYLYENGPNGWKEIQKLSAPDRTEKDWFGRAIHLKGERLMVGAPFSDLGLPGDPALNEAGAVYVFESDSSGSWVLVQKLLASDRQPHDFFGASIDVHDSLAIIGAYGKDPGGPGGDAIIQAGGAYIFRLNPNGLWTEIASLAEPDTALQDWYGFEVAIQGNTAVVGAPQEDEDSLNTNTLIDPGAVYVYQLQPDGSWPLIQKLVALDRGWALEQMGRSIAMQGDELVVARPGKRIQDSTGAYFNRGGELMIWQKGTNGYFSLDTTLYIIDAELNHSIWPGYSPSALDIEEDLLLVGGPNVFNRTGEAHLFARDSTGTWRYQRPFRDPAGETFDYFGWSVAIDTQTILIGARQKGPSFPPTLDQGGRIFVYEPCAPRFTQLRDTLCAGEQVWFAGQWLDTAGMYEELFLAVSGCDSTVALDLFVHPPLETSLNQTDTSLTALATDASLQWMSCENGMYQSISGATQATFFPDSSGWYAVIVNQVEGCSDTSECVEILLPLVSATADWTYGVQVFPNPSSGEVEIRLTGIPQPWSYQLWDVQGRKLQLESGITDQTQRISLPATPGVYLLRIQDQKGQASFHKLVRQ